MANGYFFAYASEAGARQSRPDWYRQDEEGNYVLLPPRALISATGVWITPPEGHYEGEGIDQVFVEEVPGVKSAPYVVLSPEDDGAPAKRISPAGYSGFA